LASVPFVSFFLAVLFVFSSGPYIVLDPELTKHILDLSRVLTLFATIPASSAASAFTTLPEETKSSSSSTASSSTPTVSVSSASSSTSSTTHTNTTNSNNNNPNKNSNNGNSNSNTSKAHPLHDLLIGANILISKGNLTLFLSPNSQPKSVPVAFLPVFVFAVCSVVLLFDQFLIFCFSLFIFLTLF
jgi:hypothetical protein